jgi:hypothetical protein
MNRAVCFGERGICFGERAVCLMSREKKCLMSGFLTGENKRCINVRIGKINP